MKKKRIAAVVLIAVMIVFTLSACANSEKTDAEPGGTEVEEAGADASGSTSFTVTPKPSHGGAADEAAETGGDHGAGVPAYDPHGNLKQGDGEPFVLTGGCWRDHDNWPFFTNLVNSGELGFPSYGLDPRNRIKVTVTDGSGAALRGELVELLDASGNVIWTTKSGKDGAAYLFYTAEDGPASLTCGSTVIDIEAGTPADESGQGTSTAAVNDDYTISTEPSAPGVNGLQIMFIVDTTGSMSDELAFLQKDFSSIAGEVGGEDVYFSANFYRDEGDEYVTRCNEFTQDTGAVMAQLEAEYAEGGGDAPEAVAEILAETMNGSGWREDCSKIAFLIFDAPPHDQFEESIQSSIRAAAEQGIAIIPVVASNADRSTELFARAAAIMTGGTYVFLTDDSGVGESHLEPIIGDYQVELLHDIIVRIINDYR